MSRELARRSLWADTVGVLVAAMPAFADRRDGWEMLARAAISDGQFAEAMRALEVLDPDPQRSPQLSELEVLALHGLGEQERARELGGALLLIHPELKAVRELITRHEAAMNAKTVSLHGDPLVSKARAEAYVAVGRIDRAVRWYRRLLYLHPGDKESRRRLQVLLDQPLDITEDLSEELPDPRLPPPPGLRMPSPYLESDDEVTDPTMIAPIQPPADEGGSTQATERPIGRRRSLIGRK